MEDDNEAMRGKVTDTNQKQFHLLKERDRQELYLISFLFDSYLLHHIDKTLLEDSSILGCDTVLLDDWWLQTF
jgi:hypothetical protein